MGSIEQLVLDLLTEEERVVCDVSESSTIVNNLDDIEKLESQKVYITNKGRIIIYRKRKGFLGKLMGQKTYYYSFNKWENPIEKEFKDDIIICKYKNVRSTNPQGSMMIKMNIEIHFKNDEFERVSKLIEVPLLKSKKELIDEIDNY